MFSNWASTDSPRGVLLVEHTKCPAEHPWSEMQLIGFQTGIHVFKLTGQSSTDSSKGVQLVDSFTGVNLLPFPLQCDNIAI